MRQIVFYERVRGWDAFEPALSRAETMDSDTIWRSAAEIPEEWYEGDRDGLNNRRQSIRQLIATFRKSTRNPLPSWRGAPTFNGLRAVMRDEAVEIG
jgi:hypothetical protein